MSERRAVRQMIMQQQEHLDVLVALDRALEERDQIKEAYERDVTQLKQKVGELEAKLEELSGMKKDIEDMAPGKEA